MASTLLDIGTAALSAIGQLGRGQTPSPEDGAQILRQANLLLDQKSTDRLFLYYIAIRQYNLQANVETYTLGPGGTLVGTRPTFIESAQVLLGASTWLPISVWDKEKFDAIIGKGAKDEIPAGVYPEYSFPALTLHFLPIPTGTPAFRLGCWEALTKFATLFTVVAFPPAYEEFIESNLAVRLAPFYDQPVPQGLLQRAADAQVAVQKMNAQGLGGAVSAAQSLQSPNTGRPIVAGGGQAA